MSDQSVFDQCQTSVRPVSDRTVMDQPVSDQTVMDQPVSVMDQPVSDQCQSWDQPVSDQCQTSVRRPETARDGQRRPETARDIHWPEIYTVM